MWVQRDPYCVIDIEDRNDVPGRYGSDISGNDIDLGWINRSFSGMSGSGGNHVSAYSSP